MLQLYIFFTELKQ